MKKILSFVLSLSVAVGLMSGTAMAAPKQEKNADHPAKHGYVQGELVLALEEDQTVLSSANKNPNKKLKEKKPSLKKLGFDIADSIVDYDSFEVTTSKANMEFTSQTIENMGYVYLVKYDMKKFDLAKAEKELEKILKGSGFKVKYVEPNLISEAIGATVQSVNPSQTWHYNLIKAPQAWNITTGSSAVKVAVLDTGIDHYHQSLRNFVNTSMGRSFVGSTTMDSFGHGTHVAGTIASYGSVSGVMQNATLIPVKVLGDDGRGSNYGIAQGILYASEIGADVINMSLGGGSFDSTVNNACETAVSRGTIVVAATGNDNYSSVSYPAAYDSVIAVGSVTSNGSRSWFSNYGTGIDVMAPGSDIYSTVPNNGYELMSGTSMATPHVAGLLGLMRSANRNLTPAQARSILRSTAMPAGSSNEYGYGIINAFAAVQAAQGGTTEPGTDPQPVYATSTTITADKSTYYPGESITLTAKVTDQNSRSLSGASVKFTFTLPDGYSLTYDAVTNTSGIATWVLTSDSTVALGTYTAKATAAKSGYTSSTDSTSLKFAENAVTKKTITSISTDRYYYSRGYTATASASVKDQNYQPLYGARVIFTVTRPNGTTYQQYAYTNSQGIATMSMYTNSYTATGYYKITADSTAYGYTGSYASTNIYIY